MAKKAITRTIEGIGKIPENKLVVTKSRPLTSIWASDLTLEEFKILDVYLSRIDPHNPDNRKVVFTKQELEALFKVDRIRNDVLEKRLIHLMEQVVKIYDKDYEKGYTIISVFEDADVDLDETGVSRVVLECSQKAMKYVFSVENLGYIRYKLKVIKEIKSRYTYVLFMYLESNRFRQTWTVSVEELRAILCCADDRYPEFKEFNRCILKKSQAELFQKTDCRFEFKPIKRGKKVTDVEFTVFSLVELPVTDENQLTLDIQDEEDLEEQKLEEKRLLELGRACNGEFDIDQMRIIFSVLATLPDSVLPNMDVNINVRRYHYLIQKHTALDYYAKRKKISNRFSYFLKTIKADAL